MVVFIIAGVGTIYTERVLAGNIILAGGNTTTGLVFVTVVAGTIVKAGLTRITAFGRTTTVR
jgi:hypothetical protein